MVCPELTLEVAGTATAVSTFLERVQRHQFCKRFVKQRIIVEKVCDLGTRRRLCRTQAGRGVDSTRKAGVSCQRV